MYICQTGCCFLQSARLCYTAVYWISNKRWGPLTCRRRSCGAITSETASTLSRVRCARIFESKICKKKFKNSARACLSSTSRAFPVWSQTPRHAFRLHNLEAARLRLVQLSLFRFHVSTFTFQFSFDNFHLSAFTFQLSVDNFHFSTFFYQLLFFNFVFVNSHLSNFSCQLSLTTFTFQCLLFKFHLLTLTFQLEQSWGNFRIVVRCSAVVACNLVELGRNFEWFSIFHRSRMLK